MTITETAARWGWVGDTTGCRAHATQARPPAIIMARIVPEEVADIHRWANADPRESTGITLRMMKRQG